MRLKNVSYETIEAISNDTKVVTTFLPGVEQTVDEETGKVYLQRYSVDVRGNQMLVEVEEKDEEVAETEETDEVDETEEEVKAEVECGVCGKTFKTAQALRGHSMSHK